MDANTASENRALVRRWFQEVWNEGLEDRIDELRAPDTVARGLGEGSAESRGSEPFKAFFANLRSAFPDLRVEIEDILAEGDRVAVRIVMEGTHCGDAMGVQATG